MCGLAGSYRSDWNVEAALERIAHRGPDFRGVAYAGPDQEVVHGHVRLSILDPDPRSHQPYVLPARVGALSYNGECWNYRALRAELMRIGWAFRTAGDTEVVAIALSEWGVPGALARIEGQFALAWTDAAGVTYLARDRWGEVPLYMLEEEESLLGGGVTWASERKAWTEDGYRAIPVPPGSYVQLGGSLSVRAYYRPPAELPAEALPPERGYSAVRDALTRGAEERLQSDVPVCTLLSGGLDSSAILALIRRYAPDVVAYTAYFDPDSPDLEAARYAADYYDVELREVEVPPPTLWQVAAAIETIEIAMKAQVEIALLCIPLAVRIATDGFKVVLSGEGADELFGGYGGLMRKATSDSAWKEARRYSFEKMARGNFIRTNKTFMAAGVEARLPFMDRKLVERVLNLGLEACPPGKKLLKRVVEDIVPERIVRRQKETFQGASGVSGYLEQLMGGKQVKTYNDIARELFGGLPRG